jgi:hypothetical protein
MPIVTKTIAGFSNSTPTMCYLKKNTKLLVNVRHVNYRIDEKGNYINKDKIETKNWLTLYDRKTGAIEKEFELEHNRELDNLYVGLEDVRLFEHDGKPYFTANRGLGTGQMAIEFGAINLETGKTESSILKKTDNMKAIEKNWTLFMDNTGTLKTVYGWYPFTVYDPDQRKVTTHNCSNLPPFFAHIRGSCNGIRVGSETWFLCHTVSYEDRRYYYHIIIALDTASNKVARWTKYFTLEGKQVEYALGFLYDETNEEFMLGYSTMDRTTEMIKIGKGVFDSLFV